ncbi:unnamed protein product [Rotaria sordida]|uniref:Uncharacterized protein n=1 Tax=Rotaria sordida TaxID=392033 RepID=A0A819W8Y4_9BILA|nr:unnamed protein product [Rotaria sordida]CAF1401957.1 unnamed protein product [Rotaria sordida]CAF4121014.1 unnamed protein product [Rotaria sordida]
MLIEYSDLCIRRDLLKVQFELADQNAKKIDKKIPSLRTTAKLKAFVRKLFSSQLTNDVQFNLFVIIVKKNPKELMSNGYQDIQFYLGNSFLNNNNDDQPYIITIETI